MNNSFIIFNKMKKYQNIYVFKLIFYKLNDDTFVDESN